MAATLRGTRAIPPRGARVPKWAGRRTARWATAGWATVVAAGLVVGTRAVAGRDEFALRAAPLAGHWDAAPGAAPAAAWLPAVGVGALTVAAGPAWAASTRWRPLVAGSAGLTVAWAVALAAGRGWSAVAAPLATRFEYLAVVERVDGPGVFLRTFTERIDGYPTHVRGHPPGMPLVLWGLDRLQLAGPGWAAALVLSGAGVATAAALVTTRAVAGEATARRAAPFVALAPAALWLGTSADALFAGVGATGIALVVAGRSRTSAAGGGATLAAAAFLTYGAVLLAAIATAALLATTAAAWARRRSAGRAGADTRAPAALPRESHGTRQAGAGGAGVEGRSANGRWLGGPGGAGGRLGLAAAAGVAVVVGVGGAGFWWWDGLAATHAQYRAGVAGDRPYLLFTLLMNPAALALAVGPAAVAALAVMARRRAVGPVAQRAWVLPAAALAAVVAADLSGL